MRGKKTFVRNSLATHNEATLPFCRSLPSSSEDLESECSHNFTQPDALHIAQGTNSATLGKLSDATIAGLI
eukprot:1835475-Amphidinium_carterae.1